MQKVHVGDIDIAYKVFGKGDFILLISGNGNVYGWLVSHYATYVIILLLTSCRIENCV